MATISDNALELLKKRYFIKGETTPEQMFRRVANCIAQAEIKESRDYWEQKFYDCMNNLDFMPNSPALMNCGTEIKNYSACFVLPVPDSMDGIFEAVKQAALVSKSGGGVGLSFSRLRPKNSVVGSTGGVASGPVSFMYPFNAMVECVKQGSKRRGALMGLLRVDHPDIEEFIRVKDDLTQLTNFNLSVGITDEFMDAVINDKDFDLRFDNKIYKTLKAKDLWQQIVDHAWLSGDPGLLFLDEANRHNNLKHIGDIETSNPCGEQPLLPFEACNLLSINLVNMVENEAVSYDKLKDTVKIAVRFLDNVIEVSDFPLSEINHFAKDNRKIGLGIMGFADMLYLLKIPYNSEKGLAIAKDVMQFIHDCAEEYSIELAKERGVYKNAANDNKRNAALTTIAPTGSISMICNVSGGCEPNFGLLYKRFATSMNQEFYFINPILEQELKNRGLYSEELLEKINKNNGSLKGLKEIPKDMQEVFVVASEIKPEWHVKMQAAFQNNGVDSAVSKTINLPNSATVEDVEKAYMLAYKLKCKGITVYRDGCRQNQVLTTGSSMSENNQIETKQYIKPKKRPKVTKAEVEEFNVGCGKLYITVSELDGQPFETFTNLGTAGVCPGFSAGLSRMVSLALRSGVDPEDVIDQLTSVTCANCRGKKTDAKSCPDAYGKALKRKFKKTIKQQQQQNNIEIKNEENLCPECGEKLFAESGCVRCNCGWSRCG